MKKKSYKDKKLHKAAENRRRRENRRGRLVAVIIALSLFAAGGFFAQQKTLQSSAVQISPASLSPGSPSKEYVYAGGRLIATEEPEACVQSLLPTTRFFTLNGGDDSVIVTAPVGCNWTAASNAAWLEITSQSSGTGNGVVSYIVRDNFTAVPRQGVLTIGGKTLTVTQDSSASDDCTYTISPTSLSFGAGGGSGSVSVFAEERCAWQAISNASWVTVTSGCCGISNGTVAYTVAANTTGLGRNATITVAGRVFNVKQKP